MLLTKVVINDFGVYRGRNEFDFQTKPDKPIILCGGTNGAGKTTLFESVMLCLYGQSSFEQKTSQKMVEELKLVKSLDNKVDPIEENVETLNRGINQERILSD